MKRIILARLAPLIEAWGTTGSYRVLAHTRYHTLILVRRDDPSINADDWKRGAGQ